MLHVLNMRAAHRRNFFQDTDLSDVVADDYDDFGRLVSAFSKLGLSSEQVDHVFECVAAVLHLGNIHFSEKVDDFRGMIELNTFLHSKSFFSSFEWHVQVFNGLGNVAHLWTSSARHNNHGSSDTLPSYPEQNPSRDDTANAVSHLLKKPSPYKANELIDVLLIFVFIAGRRCLIEKLAGRSLLVASRRKK